MTSAGRELTSPPALAVTVHDPEARFLPVLRKVGDALGWYAAVTAAVTVTTAPVVSEALTACGVAVMPVALGATGEARRVAIRRAAGARPHAIVSCDFDRWLHWAWCYPDELRALPEQIAQLASEPWFVCLGRTGRAFATHPDVQRVAEDATNRALELMTSWPIDATAGAAWISPDGYDLVLGGSKETTSATDLEWPALVHRAAPDRLRFVALEGLEFETATFYGDEIAQAGGREAWIRAWYDRPGVWASRLRLAADSVAALASVLPDVYGG